MRAEPMALTKAAEAATNNSGATMSDNTTRLERPTTAMEAVSGLELHGKNFVITGAYAGLGAATTRALLAAGARVVVAGRNPVAQERFAEELSGDGSFNTDQVDASQTLDLGSLASVREFATYIESRYERIDCLINNAGVMNTPPGVTADGFETQFGINVVGHFLLAKLLARATKRQVWLSSKGHANVGAPPFGHDPARAPRIDLDAIKKVDGDSYDGWRRYQQSKLGNVLLARQFPLEYPHLTACSVHPGIVRTNLSRHTSIWALLRFVIAMPFGGERPVSPERGASTQTFCAVTAELEQGAYLSNARRQKRPKPRTTWATPNVSTTFAIRRRYRFKGSAHSADAMIWHGPPSRSSRFLGAMPQRHRHFSHSASRQRTEKSIATVGSAAFPVGSGMRAVSTSMPRAPFTSMT